MVPRKMQLHRQFGDQPALRSAFAGTLSPSLLKSVRATIQKQPRGDGAAFLTISPLQVPITGGVQGYTLQNTHFWLRLSACHEQHFSGPAGTNGEGHHPVTKMIPIKCPPHVCRSDFFVSLCTHLRDKKN